MKHRLIISPLLATLSMLSPAMAEAESTPAAEPAEVLRLLQAPDCTLSAVERDYRKGEALTRLARYEDAAESFYRVPSTHPLYPYAARGILYCARRSPHINFVEVCAPLTVSSHPEIAQLALAELAEYQLRYTKQGDPSSLAQLTRMAEDHPEYTPLVKLLGIHIYRRNNDYEGGIEYARALEHDAELSATMRQRVRLELAELYYDKEKAAPDATPNDSLEKDEGKGEETLLQFITANPDSALLEEAFRRLNYHGALAGSEYTREKLHEWAEDTMHPKRAALSLYALLSTPQNSAEAAAIANRAAAQLSGEPLTRSILQEHIRRLFAQGKLNEAKLYIPLLMPPGEAHPSSPALFFYGLSLQEESPREALRAFLRCAEQADGSLYTPAMVNALICAHRAGDTAAEQSLLSAPVTNRTRRALLLTHAGLIMQREPAVARQELAEVKKLHPSPAQSTDMMLDEAYLDMADNPEGVLERLISFQPEERQAWSDAQVLRYAALVEQAKLALGAADCVDFLKQLYDESQQLARREALALHLADIYAQKGEHRMALNLLLELAQQQSTGESKAATLLYAGHESAQLGNLAALEHAARLYAESARQGSNLTPKAVIEQAAVLVRINRTQEALDLLLRLEQSHKNLTADEKAHILTVRADAIGPFESAERSAQAIETCRQIEDLPGVDVAWRTRARLQHASLCARLRRYGEALEDYRSVLRSERASADPSDEKSCFLFYYAGVGAVYQLLQMEQFSEAAALAEEIANWGGDALRNSKSEAFMRWAQSIRQTHYLPSSAFSAADENAN